MAETDPNPTPNDPADGAMSLLEHLDELRSRLFRATVGYVVVFAGCYAFNRPVLEFLLEPIQRYIDNGAIVFLNLPEPFFIKLKASALLAAFVAAPWILYQVWAFVVPGLHRHERRWVLPFLFFGTVFFVGGGAFGYYVALPNAARWLIAMGDDYQAAISIRSAFQFESWILLGMGAVFQMPVLIFVLSRVGLVTPRFLMQHFRHAVLIMAILSAILTPTGDWVTMSTFAGPMVLLYLLGVFVAWVAQRRDRSKKKTEEAS